MIRDFRLIYHLSQNLNASNWRENNEQGNNACNSFKLNLLWLGKRKVTDSNDRYKGLARKTRHRLEKLEKYEFPDNATQRLKRKFPFNKMSDQEIKDCIVEFKKYMAISLINRAHKKRTAMTSEIVDEVWHTFMLFSQEYHQFSKLLVGEYIHHTPNTRIKSNDPVSKLIHQTSIQNFYETYQKYFGEPSPVWKCKVEESVLSDSTNKNLMMVKYDLIQNEESYNSYGTSYGEGSCGSGGCDSDGEERRCHGCESSGDGCDGCGGCD